MADRREEILTKHAYAAQNAEYHIERDKAHSAMDEYMKECCLELLGYMAKNNIKLSPLSTPDRPCFLCKGEILSKEQLFENFL